MRKSVRVVVELSANLPRPVAHRLVRAAYRASRSGPVALVLRGVDPAAVDAMLDAEVVETGVDVPGVVYLTEDDPARIASTRCQADIVITCSDLGRAPTANGDRSLDAENPLGAIGRSVERARPTRRQLAATNDALHER